MYKEWEYLRYKLIKHEFNEIYDLIDTIQEQVVMYQVVMRELSVRRAMENSNVVFLDDWRK